MNKVIVNILFVSLFVLLGACRTTDSAVPGVVFIGGKALSKQISVENVSGAQTESGTRKVWAGIHNRTKNRLMVEVRAVFLGDKGEPIESEGAWRQIFIEPGTTASFDAYSKSSVVKKVTIEIREGNQ